MSDLFQRIFPPASLAGVVFPMEQADAEGGHDFAEHTSYGRAGSDSEPTGRKAYAGSFRIPFINGLRGFGDNLFPGRYQDFVAAVEANPLAELVHPTRRRLTVAVLSWREELTPGVTNGLWMTVRWREQNATSRTVFEGIVADDDAARDPSTLAADTDAQAAAVPGGVAGYAPTAPVVDAQGPRVTSGELAYRDVIAAVAAMLSAVNANLALPALEAPAALPALLALLALRRAVFAMRDAAIPTLGRARPYLVPRDMAAWQVSREVYGGDTTLSAAILAANYVANAARIPAGTVLTILPLS